MLNEELIKDYNHTRASIKSAEIELLDLYERLSMLEDKLLLEKSRKEVKYEN